MAMVKVEFKNTESGYKLFRDGLPPRNSPFTARNSPFTHTVSNINNIDENIAENCETSLFADDLALWTIEESIEQAKRNMRKVLKSIEEWALTLEKGDKRQQK
ncbi:hypothetical protein ElyMa_001329000 [Elysia marginata]|uniref:Reverse transcriptase domain-containing protein n=1 Tax=Elysia marginata TaxID=1093978 RepID=A0AAV4IJI3_9GAST|nr:hypothetical protein ElyMa_001329000 [Elysia marginata]